MERETQIKSKRRIVEHGEVFTSDREVKAMLDLVKDETQRIESRFLEPACGNGNFLVEILRRKLEVISNAMGRANWILKDTLSLLLVAYMALSF